MRSKPTIILILLCVGFAVFSLRCVLKLSHQHDYGIDLVFSDSVSDIDEKFRNNPRFAIGMVSPKQEVTANEAHYVFYQTIPISGLAVHGIYCFEQLEGQPSNEKYWILRGYFPINAGHFINRTHAPAPPTFSVDGDSVKIKIDGIDLYTINSFAAACKVPFLLLETNTP